MPFPASASRVPIGCQVTPSAEARTTGCGRPAVGGGADRDPARLAVRHRGQARLAGHRAQGGRRFQRPRAARAPAPDRRVAVRGADGKVDAADHLHRGDGNGAALAWVPGQGRAGEGGRHGVPRRADAGLGGGGGRGAGDAGRGRGRRAGVRPGGEHFVGLAGQHHQRARPHGDDDRGGHADRRHLQGAPTAGRGARPGRRPRPARRRRLPDRPLPGPEQLVGLVQRRCPGRPRRRCRARESVRAGESARARESVRSGESVSARESVRSGESVSVREYVCSDGAWRPRADHDRRAERHLSAAGQPGLRGEPALRVLVPARARPPGAYCLV